MSAAEVLWKVQSRSCERAAMSEYFGIFSAKFRAKA